VSTDGTTFNVPTTFGGGTWNTASLSLTNGSSYILKARATDNLGNVSSILDIDTFTVDTTVPTVATYTPAHNATSIATNTTLSLTFDEAVTVSGTVNLVIKRVSDHVTVGTLALSPATYAANAPITTAAASGLSNSIQYYVTTSTLDATNRITDTAGNAFAGISSDAIWRFTTAVPIVATGGTITTINVGGTNYRVHTFTTVGTSTFTVTSGGGNVEYLIVGGGGGGGGVVGPISGNGSGGGGGGGVALGTTSVSSGSFTITVGNGGAGGTSSSGTTGSASAFGSLTAGGGGGGGPYGVAGRTGGIGATVGGSGGGGGRDSGTSSGGAEGSTAGNGTGTFNNNGGAAGGTTWSSAGGGGGAGAVGFGGGADSTSRINTSTASQGGAGISSGISGTVKWYGGGGGGAWQTGSVKAPGGQGGGGQGGSGVTPTTGGSATANTGGGGGGAQAGMGGNGGSGIVIIRYPI
jgi:hypothetical protein